MIKKTAAVFLSVLMILSVFSFNICSADNDVTATVYVNSSVLVSGNGKTEKTAFKTLDEAISAVDNVTADKRIVKIIGDYELPQKLATHTNAITLCGNTGTADKLVLSRSITDIGGALTIDDITMLYKDKYAIFAMRNPLEFGKGVVSTGEINGNATDDWNDFRPEIVSGGYAAYTNSNTTPAHKMTVNSGKFWNVFLGESALRTEWTCVTNGADFEMNGGAVYNLRIGGNAWDGNRGENSYKGNVNITVNGGNIYGGISVLDNVSTSAQYKSPSFNGNAIQILLNNGISVSTLPQAAAVEGFGGKLYVLKSEKKAGCYLSTTDKTGEFKVTATEELDALAVDEDGNKTRSENGVLKLAKAGTYTVSFVPAQISQTLYVDSANGSDTNTGSSTTAALKTLDRAFTLLESSENENPTVKIIGTYTIDSTNNTLPTHTKAITLSGADNTSALNLAETLNTNGSVIFKNVKLTLSAGNRDVKTNGGEVTVDESVTIANYPYLRFYTGLTNADNTSVETATLKSGHIDALWVGTNDVRDTSGKTTAGANITIDGAQLRYLRLGGHGYDISGRPSLFYDTIFTGNVSVTVSSGQIGTLVVMSPEGESQNTRNTVFKSAVQIIVNENGYIGAMPEIVAEKGVWYMDGHSQSGGSIKVTDTAGKFKVEGGKTAFAYSKDGTAVYKSSDGYLTVPAGEYTVSYADDPAFINVGSLVKFFKDTTIDIADLTPPEKSGKMFLGWKKFDGENSTYVKNGVMKAGDELVADYIDVSSDTAEESSAFSVLGTQIRLDSSNAKKDLRFVLQLGKDILNKSEITVNEYGAVALPSAYVEVSELLIDGKQVYNTDAQLENWGDYEYNGVSYKPAVVKAEKIFKDSDDCLQYTICLTGIKSVKFSTLYAVRGYIKYTDANGIDRVVYTDCFNDSMVEAAERMLSVDGLSNVDRQPLEEIGTSSIAALKAKYDYSDTSETINYSVNYEPYTMSDNIIYGSDGNVAMTYRQFNKTGLTVRDIDIDAVEGNSNTETVNIIQITDTHLNYQNAEDIAEANPAIMANLKWRGVNNMNNLNGRRKNYDRNLVNLVNALEFAKAYGDQTMVTGDVIDYLAYGSLDLMKRYICNFDKNAILLQGNHDVVRANSSARPDGAIDDLSSLESRNVILSKYWTNDLFYTSKVIKNKVMVIQLDNGQNKFYDEQATLLEADLKTARENNYTVLLFAHIQVGTGDSNDKVYTSMLDSDPHLNGLSVKTFVNSGRVVDLIKNNGDVIKGVFTGHQHADFYTEIKAKTPSGNDVIIPQYVLTGNFYDNGHVIKINVK